MPPRRPPTPAAAPAPKRRHGEPGRHAHPARILRAPQEQLDRWAEVAAACGMTWSDWVRQVLDEAADRFDRER